MANVYPSPEVLDEIVKNIIPGRRIPTFIIHLTFYMDSRQNLVCFVKALELYQED